MSFCSRHRRLLGVLLCQSQQGWLRLPDTLLCSSALALLQFNIVPWHCLVVTAKYRSQLDDRDAADLAATWAVVQVGGGCCRLQSGLTCMHLLQLI